MKKRSKVIIAVLGIVCVIAIGMFISVSRSAKTAANNISVQVADAIGISDGVYDGHYEVSPVKVSVRVTVADEEIVDIVILEHETGLGGKAEAIVDDIIAQQSLDIDAISGATVSSKVILKATEDALKSREVEYEK